MEKSEAFLIQAKSELEIYKFLAAQDRSLVAECHVLHYLQMATEKFAKAVLLKQGTSVKRNHIAFTKLHPVLLRRDIAKKLGYGDPKKYKAFKAFLKRNASLFMEIEILNPAVASQTSSEFDKQDKANVEYPWWELDASGARTWIVPVKYSFNILVKINQRNDARNLINLLSLFERLVHD